MYVIINVVSTAPFSALHLSNDVAFAFGIAVNYSIGPAQAAACTLSQASSFSNHCFRKQDSSIVSLSPPLTLASCYSIIPRSKLHILMNAARETPISH